MSARAAETAMVAALAAAITMAIAAPVLRAPSDRIFGAAIAGHHDDPFTFMQQIARPIVAGIYVQPVTDVPGALLARGAGPVAAYNWIVLLTFPLAAVAAYLLARHLAIAPVWAGLSALAFAFSPFHLSHAAYHPHIAQTQWIALYVLALWRCLDAPSRGTAGLLALSAAAVALSNFYGGLIAAVITPAAVGAHWLVNGRTSPRPFRGVAVACAALGAIALAGLGYAWYAANDLLTHHAAYGAAAEDLVRYGTRWWSYLMPPVQHPWLGGAVRNAWHNAGVDIGLVEQQVALGWGVVALSGVAVHRWLAPSDVEGRDRGAHPVAAVPVLLAVAVAAFIWSLAAGPSGYLHQLLPMFRSYARFGVVVQLMTVLLAGIGAQWLWRRGTPRARVACVMLMGIAAVEYAVWPGSMSRSVLPTMAHRWAERQPSRVRVLDCVPAAEATPSVQWLTHYRVSAYVPPFDDCTEPNLVDKLAAAGYTHLIVRRDTPPGRRFASMRTPDGLQAAASFPDSDVYAVAALAPRVHTVSMTDFHPREHDATWTWRWMGSEAAWTVANRSGAPVIASVDIEIMAFRGALGLTVLLDGREVQVLTVDERRGVRHIGPLSLTPGDHYLTFRPRDPAALSFRFGGWRWNVQETQP